MPINSFIPRVIGELGNAIFPFLEESGNPKAFLGESGQGIGNLGMKIFKVIPYEPAFKLEVLNKGIILSRKI